MHALNTIYVLNKISFSDIMKLNNINSLNVESKNLFIVSINNSNETLNDTFFKKDFNNVLHLFFDDISEESKVTSSGKIVYGFSEEQGKKLLMFLDNIDINKKHFIVHCNAGISRSGAVGTFVCDYFDFNYDQFKRLNPMIRPNSRVLSIMRKLSNFYQFE